MTAILNTVVELKMCRIYVNITLSFSSHPLKHIFMAKYFGGGFSYSSLLPIINDRSLTHSFGLQASLLCGGIFVSVFQVFRVCYCFV